MDNMLTQLQEVALRIREMRAVMNLSTHTMAEKTGVSEDSYIRFESGEVDLPFTLSLIHIFSPTNSFAP